MSDKQRTGEKAGREGGGGPPPEPEPDRDIFVVLLALRTATKMASMMLNAAQKGQEMVEGASRYVSMTIESIMPDPFSRWLTRFRQMTYFQWFLLAVMGLFLAVITPPALILLGLFSAVALPVTAVTSPFWGPVAVVLLALTFPLWSPALAGLAVFQWTKERLTKLEGHLPKPARGVIGWFRGMSRMKQGLALFALAAASVLGIGALLVVGTPVVVIGGGLLLFFSPVILLTAPLWIPVVLFFLAVAAVVLGGGGFLLAMAVSAYWLYRYYRGPMPLGGESVYKLQRKMGGMLDRTRQTITGKAV